MTFAALRADRAAIPSGERIVGERIVMGLKLSPAGLLFK
jgi:hypothetical protein